jgi:hypothetical protein
VREGFEVIQACNPPDTYFLLGLIYRLFGKTFVYDHHDLSPEMFQAKFPGAIAGSTACCWRWSE